MHEEEMARSSWQVLSRFHRMRRKIFDETSVKNPPSQLVLASLKI